MDNEKRWKTRRKREKGREEKDKEEEDSEVRMWTMRRGGRRGK